MYYVFMRISLSHIESALFLDLCCILHSGYNAKFNFFIYHLSNKNSTSLKLILNNLLVSQSLVLSAHILIGIFHSQHLSGEESVQFLFVALCMAYISPSFDMASMFVCNISSVALHSFRNCGIITFFLICNSSPN